MEKKWRYRYVEFAGSASRYRLAVSGGAVLEIAVYIPPRGFGGRGFYMPAKVYTSLSRREELKRPISVAELRRLVRDGEVLIC